MLSHQITPPYYPIVYVRGYAMTSGEREDTFNDAYYGFSATSVEKRQVPKDKNYLVADVFEGQLIRLMKNKEYGYADSSNRGLNEFYSNPSRSIWVSRFYDVDYIHGKIRSIEEHAQELTDLIVNVIPKRLLTAGVDEESIKNDYKVILIAHSMGGLVCRTVIQNILVNPKYQVPSEILSKDHLQPVNLIHRLATMGTPHRGIDLGNLPDAIENRVVNALNPFDSSMFKEERMREYLNLSDKRYDVHSLGDSGFPVNRCLCIIGSDYSSYSVVRLVTGGFSDGLVKQNRAYIVAGKKPADEKYPEENTAFYANVHRAHSGFRGIVNSYESYENVQRFLFGDMKIRISLTNIEVNHSKPSKRDTAQYYDFEFAISIRGTSVYLHRREQELCENAIRFDKDKIPDDIHLHTGFLNSRLRESDDPYSYFILKFRVLEYRKEALLFWDKYPSREIYAESLEVRLGNYNDATNSYSVEYRWHADVDDENSWQPVVTNGSGVIRIPLRQANSLSGTVRIEAGNWPDEDQTKDRNTPPQSDDENVVKKMRDYLGNISKFLSE